ncbi:MAG: hypothetical protein HYV15_00740 [Elusimicrobia bacterium]|nr:hypothetical protein [Elusimicrobiota bacterium]
MGPLLLAAAAFLAAAPLQAAAEPEDIAQALEALYDLEPRRSLDIVGARIAAEPQEPFYRLFDAGVLWWWSSAEPGLFKSSAPLEARFTADLAAAFALTEPRLADPDPKVRADALFIAGLSRGIEAQAELGRGHWVKAYLSGRRGRRLMVQCLEADPAYADAEIGIGLYDYLADHVPGVLRFGALLLVRGDGPGGLKRLRRAAKEGRFRFAATQAASNIVTVDILLEGDYADALAVLGPLRQAYPRSPYFRFVEAVALYKAGDWPASRERALALWQDAEADPAAFAPKRLAALCGLDGASCFLKPALTAAADWLTRALDDPAPAPEGWRALCRLYRGFALDMLGRRPEALADFAGTVEDPAAPEASKAWARHCLAAPCGPEDAAAFLRTI